MKKQDLKQCFDKIVPSDELVSDTVSKVENSARRESRRGFALSYRLASAVCALVLVLGLGVFALRDPAMIPLDASSSRGSAAAVRSRSASNDAVPAAHTTLDAAIDMADRAYAQGGEWAVLAGNLDGCYFNGATPDGAGYRLTLVITPSAGAEIFLSSGAELTYAGSAVSVDIRLADLSEADGILSLVSRNVIVRFDGSNGELWTLEEIISAKK